MNLSARSFIIVFVCLLVIKFAIVINFDLLSINRQIPLLWYKSNIQERTTNLRINAKKWIVITTVNYPTNEVKALASQKGWRVVIVADKKTPLNWSHTNCDFLSVEQQKQMSLSILAFIPFQSYTRKMIGYLYAIQNGAQWIYDTDDDNEPIHSGISLFDTTESLVSGLSYGHQFGTTTSKETRNLFNPYEFWGQPKIWPRGYPLENVRHENEDKHFKLCKRQKVPAIQQGLVMKDPDVDALYRLLNADESTGLNVNFSEHAPPVIINPGTFCPFNSQNTLFHYDAFWSLFLPVSVAFRVTDIWRSYFAQKLLHLTGNRIGFYPTNAVQKRNAHSYLADLKDEMQLYGESGKLIDFISNWTCQFKSLQECMKKLSNDFAVNKFWTTLDFELVKAWTRDLETIGYIFPALVEINPSKSEDCRSAVLHFTADRSESVSHIKQDHGELKDWCNKALPSEKAFADIFDENKDFNKDVWKNLSRIALIVTGNYPFGPSLSILQRLYGNHFATVIFCGIIDSDKVSKSTGFLTLHKYNYINLTKADINVGYRAYICPVKTIELRLQNIDGYLTIADDTMFNFWNDFDFSRFRLYGTEWDNRGGFWWNDEKVGRNAMQMAIELITNRTNSDPLSSLSKAFAEYSKHVGGDGFSPLRVENRWSISDFYYLPKENETVFYELAQIFLEADLYHEIAVSKIGAGLEWFRYYNSSEK